MKKILLLLLAVTVVCCRASQDPNTNLLTKELELSCSMTKTEFSIGEKLPPPKVTIRNGTDSDVNLIGPTITVIACTLVQPDKTTVRMCLAMPTGLGPREMPPRKLKSQETIDFAPTGMWYYHDGIGYEPYSFSQEGAYEFFCQYEKLTSKVIELKVKRTSE